MKILTIEEAEKLKDVIHPGDGYDESIERYRFLVEIRELYGKGFAVCLPEDLLWDDFKTRMKDIGAG